MIRIVFLLVLFFTSGALLISGCSPMGQKPQEPTPPPPPPPQPLVEPKPLPPPPPPKEPAPRPEVKKEEPPKPKYIEHVVRWKGETLAIIAKWYTGKFGNWKALVEANPHINPKRMRKGHIIRIPMELVKTQEPMPKSFVKRHRPKKSEEEPILFGPKK